MSKEQIHPLRTVLWRRLDVDGMDACSFGQCEDGYEISGSALYLDGKRAIKLDYRVSCNSDWSTRAAWVSRWVGSERKGLSISRDTAVTWTVDGVELEEAAGLLDVDLGFTPATNTNAIKRLSLGVGDEAETTAVCLDTDDWCFKPLTQIYRRLSETEFAYCSPSHDYSATLIVDDFGIVREYPELWMAVSKPSRIDRDERV